MPAEQRNAGRIREIQKPEKPGRKEDVPAGDAGTAVLHERSGKTKIHGRLKGRAAGHSGSM